MRTKSFGFVLSIVVLLFTISCGKLKEKITELKKREAGKNSGEEQQADYEMKPVSGPDGQVIFSLNDLQFYNRYISYYNSLYANVEFAENEYFRIIPAPRELANDPIISVHDITSDQILEHRIETLEKENNSDEFRPDDTLMETNFKNGLSNLLHETKSYLYTLNTAYTYYKNSEYKEDILRADKLNDKVGKAFEDFNKQAKGFGRLIDLYVPVKLRIPNQKKFEAIVQGYNTILNEAAIVFEIVKGQQPGYRKESLKGQLDALKRKYINYKARMLSLCEDEPVAKSDFESIFDLALESFISSTELFANYNGSEDYTFKRLKNDVISKYAELINAYNTCASGIQATGVKIKY